MIIFVQIGQRHGGFLGILQRALARASPHIWFERSEVKDREAVAKRLRQHVSDPRNPPILIFPEGTCINNTSVMQFKKGSFEVGSVIYPVAIKVSDGWCVRFLFFSLVLFISHESSKYMLGKSCLCICTCRYFIPDTTRCSSIKFIIWGVPHWRLLCELYFYLYWYSEWFADWSLWFNWHVEQTEGYIEPIECVFNIILQSVVNNNLLHLSSQYDDNFMDSLRFILHSSLGDQYPPIH